MIIYMADPQDIINSMEYQATIQIPLPSGAFVRAEPLENNQARIIDVISTDPMDYMYEQYQPGKIVSLS